MKKIIIIILACVFCPTVNAELKQLDITIAEEEITYTNSSQGVREKNEKINQISVPKLSNAIQVSAGQKIELISAAAQFSQPHHSGGGDVTLSVELEGISEPLNYTLNFNENGSISNAKVKYMRSTVKGLGDGGTPLFFGPCKLSLGLTQRYRNDYNFIASRAFAIANFKISAIDDSGSAGRGSNYSLVIPETTGDATLVLESSDDLVNWEVDTVGDKPKGNRRKFYRLRARQQ